MTATGGRCGSPPGVAARCWRCSIFLPLLPIIVLYAIGRRQLLSGLTAGFGK
jgi:raffinose/stachyose/melibiose transport system permease protein